MRRWRIEVQTTWAYAKAQVLDYVTQGLEALSVEDTEDIPSTDLTQQLGELELSSEDQEQKQERMKGR